MVFVGYSSILPHGPHSPPPPPLPPPPFFPLFLLSSQQYFSARGNDLQGRIPRSLILGCTGLEELFLYDNPQLQGVEEASEQLLKRYGSELQFRLR
jgi:hypothetical protein